MGLFAGTPWDIPATCETCGARSGDCQCPPPPPPAPQWLPADKQTARVRVEKRKAKRTVTVVAGLSEQASDLPALLSQLKAACGAGGAREGENLVLQGDHCGRVSQLLRSLGYRVRP